MIVVYLHIGEAKQAWALYQDFLDVDLFSNSAEAMSAENVLSGYCSGDPAVIKQRLSQGRTWGNLDAAVRVFASALWAELSRPVPPALGTAWNSHMQLHSLLSAPQHCAAAFAP